MALVLSVHHLRLLGPDIERRRNLTDVVLAAEGTRIGQGARRDQGFERYPSLDLGDHFICTSPVL